MKIDMFEYLVRHKSRTFLKVGTGLVSYMCVCYKTRYVKFHTKDITSKLCYVL